MNPPSSLSSSPPACSGCARRWASGTSTTPSPTAALPAPPRTHSKTRSSTSPTGIGRCPPLGPPYLHALSWRNTWTVRCLCPLPPSPPYPAHPRRLLRPRQLRLSHLRLHTLHRRARSFLRARVPSVPCMAALILHGPRPWLHQRSHRRARRRPRFHPGTIFVLLPRRLPAPSNGPLLQPRAQQRASPPGHCESPPSFSIYISISISTHPPRGRSSSSGKLPPPAAASR